MRYLTLFVAVIFFLLLIFYLVKVPKKEIVIERERKVLLIKGESLYVEIADNPEERAIGLSFRKNLPHNEGMLFIFEKEGIYPFWMRNTFIPLDIAFISKDNIIIDIQRMVPLDDKRTYQPDKPFLYALEVNQGYFEERGIKVGDTIYLRW